MLRSILIAAIITTGLAATIGAAGTAEPLVIRPVVLAGGSGPAYYSVIEQGYRLVGGLADITMADNAKAATGTPIEMSLVSHETSAQSDAVADGIQGN